MIRASLRKATFASKSLNTCTCQRLALRSLSTLQRSSAPTATKLSRGARVPRFMPLTAVRTYAETIKVPEMAESITEGTLKEFSKQVGDFVKQDEEVASIETDKIDVAVNAPMSGTITELLAQPDDTVEVGQELFRLEPGEAPAGGAAPKEESKPAESKKEDAKPAQEDAKPAKEAAPKDEKPAPKKEETKAAAPKPAAKPAPSSTEASSATAAFSRNETPVKMNRMRLRIAERLKESQNTAATLTTFNEVDMSALLSMRKLYKDEIIKKKNIKFGFMGLFSKACTLAMKEWPAVNAAIVGPNIVYHDYVDISIAVATPKGLVTPVVRNAESLDVLGIEQEIVNLSVKARDGQLSLEDMAGGTFTISNGGVFGSLMGTPIINMPQCAVLGLHGVKDRAVVVDGKVESRPMMYLALSYDHRIVDGREAVSFLRTVKELIEDPRKMLL